MNWAPGVSHVKQMRYQPVVDSTYWPVLDVFNNSNILQFINKSTTSDYFGDIYKVLLDGISESMESLMQKENYGDINTTDTETIVHYVKKYVSDAIILQEDNDTDYKVSKAYKLAIIFENLISLKAKTS